MNIPLGICDQGIELRNGNPDGLAGHYQLQVQRLVIFICDEACEMLPLAFNVAGQLKSHPLTMHPSPTDLDIVQAEDLPMTPNACVKPRRRRQLG